MKEDFIENHVRAFWPEMMVELTTLESYAELTTPEIRSYIDEISQAGVCGYNMIDPYRKLLVLSWIIELIYELTVFRNCMSNLLEKQSELAKEKAVCVENK